MVSPSNLGFRVEKEETVRMVVITIFTYIHYEQSICYSEISIVLTKRNFIVEFDADGRNEGYCGQRSWLRITYLFDQCYPGILIEVYRIFQLDGGVQVKNVV